MSFRNMIRGTLIAGLLAGVCVVTASAACVGVGTVEGDGLRLRAGGDINASVITTSEKGATVLVLEDANGWYKVDYGTQVGYMAAGYVKVETTVEADLGYAAVTTKGDPLNIRAGAGTEYATLLQIPNGAVAQVVGFTDGWFKITYSDVTGYVSSEYMTPVLDETGARKDGEQVVAQTSALGARIVAEAQKHVGKPYRGGCKGPNAFDCSGFAYYVTKQASGGSIVLSGGSSTQWRTAPGQRIYSIAELQPGDLFFICDPAYSAGYPTSHVAIYMGNNMLIHAADYGKGVVINPVKDKDVRYFVGGIRLG